MNKIKEDIAELLSMAGLICKINSGIREASCPQERNIFTDYSPYDWRDLSERFVELSIATESVIRRIDEIIDLSTGNADSKEISDLCVELHDLMNQTDFR